MWCNTAVNKSPIFLPYVLQCISHTNILNHSQCKDAAWEEAFYAIEEGIFYTLKRIHKSSLLIILAFWFFWVSQFWTSEELCWHLFCEGLNLNQIQRCHVPKIKRFWHDKISFWKFTSVKYIYKSLVSKYIFQILRKVTQKEVITRNLPQWHLGLIYESWPKGIPLRLFHWEAFQPVISFPLNSKR